MQNIAGSHLLFMKTTSPVAPMQVSRSRACKVYNERWGKGMLGDLSGCDERRLEACQPPQKTEATRTELTFVRPYIIKSSF